MAQENPIYKFLRENNLTQKGEVDFLAEYSTPEKARELYGFIQSNGLTEKDFDSFYGEYFKKKAPTEVSGQDSASGVPTSGEPLSTSQAPDEDLGSRLTQAEAEVIANTGNQYLDTYVPEGTQVLTALNTEAGASVAVLDQDGEVRNVIPPVEVVAPIQKTPEVGSGESMGNSFKNMLTHIQGLPAKSALLITQKAATDPVLNAQWLALSAATGISDPNEARTWAFNNLDELAEEYRPVRGIIESVSGGDLGGLAAGVVDAATSVLSSLLIAAPTAGGGLLVDMSGESIYSYNTTKAERLGITTDELYSRGLGNDLTPVITGAAGYGLERIGLRGITSAINRNLTNKFVRDASILGADWSKEGLTEWTQLGLETYNEAIAGGLTQQEAIELAGQAMGSEEGAEVFLKGLIGSGVVSGTARAAKTILRKQDREQVQQLQQSTQELVTAAYNTQDPGRRGVLLDAAATNSEQVSAIQSENQDIVDGLAPEAQQEVTGLISRLESLQEAALDPNTPDGARQALEQQAEEVSARLDEIISQTQTQEGAQTGVQAESQQELVSVEMVEEGQAQPGQYFTRDIGGEQTVYRRNEDGTASIVPDSEAQNILSQQTEASGTSLQGSQQGGLSQNNAPATQDFFTAVVEGTDPRFIPIKPYETEGVYSPEQTRVAEAMEPKFGNFDTHIATSIPQYRETQVKKAAGIIAVLEGREDARVFDIGGSEGNMVKTVTELTGVETYNLEPNEAMASSHEATPVEGSTVIREAFYEGFDGHEAHVPTEKYDVVNESMVFQFITPERKQFIDHVADNYLKEDGLFISEEKLKTNRDLYIENEAQKDSEHKSKYYTPEQLKLKSDQVLMGMDENQADVRDYIESLKDRFDHVGIYWNSGNFYGVAASNSKQTFDTFMASVGDTQTQYTKVTLGEVTDLSTIPSSSQSTQELNTSTFFETVTDSGSRKNRIEQLKQRLSDNLKADQNLGISQDSKGRAKRDIDFLRDLTELAILSIADGTVKTAEAFRNLARGIGDFGDNVLNRAYTAATQSVEEYQTWARPKEATDERVGELLTRMQDINVDRAPAKTKIRPKQVRELTDGGIKGKVNLTNRQALREQIKTLNRGIRDGKAQIAESRKAITDFIKDMRDQGLFRGKVRGSTVAALINRVNRANTPRQLENALDYAEKASRILDYDQKVSQAGKLRNRAKTLSKRRGMPANLSAALKDVGRVDLRHVDNIEHFIDITDRFMATVEGQTTSTSAQEIQSLTDSISRLAEKAKVQRLQEMLIDAGMDADVVSELDTLPKLNEFIDSLPVEAKDNQGESRDDIRKRLYEEQREQLNEIDGSTLTPLQKQALDALKELDVSGLEGEVLALAARGLTNAIVNGRFDGMRDIISEHAKQQMLSDKPFIQKVREAVRTPGKWGDSIRKTAGTVTARMVSVLHNPQNIGLVNRLVNYTGIKNSTVQAARRYEREVIKPLQDIFKKHRKDLSNPQEQVKLAMYQDLAQYRESWSQEERQKQFQDRKQAIEETIDRLETELENNEWATESQRNYLENLKAVYDSTIRNTQRPEDIEAILSAGARALNEFQQNFWANLFPEFVDNARITNNVDIDTDWVNYNPRSYQTVDARGERLKEEWESILNENGSAFFGNFNLSAEASGSQRNRTVTGAQLPSNKVIDLRAIDSFYEMSKKALYDIETQQERATASALMRSGQVEAVVGSNVTMNVIRDAVMQKVRADAFQLLPPRERTTITRIWDGIQTWSARQALGGFLQIAKQSVPVVMDATIRLGSRAWMMPAAMQTYWRNTDAVNSMVNSRAVGARAVQSIIQSEGRVRDKQRSQANRELRDRLGRITDLADRGIDFMTMEMLKIGDAASARSVWLAFYMEHRNRHGVKNIDIVQESENINQEAAEYADTMTDTVANISDPSLRPKMLSGGWGRAFSIISPFASFSINNKIDFISNMARLREARDAGDVARIARNAAGNLTALVTYQAVGWGIRYMAIKSAAQLVTYLVNKAGDWDDEEEELAKEFIREWKEEKLEGNKWNSLFYLANDIAYGGIAQEIVEPLAGQPIADLLNYVIGDEKVKAQQFQSGQWEGFGRYGIPATRVSDFYKNFSNWTETNEEYQMRKFSEEDAWGEQRYVPLEYTDIKRPEISRDAMGLVTVANSVAMFSLYNQEVASIVRRLPGMVREIENIIDGRDKPDSLKELERLKSFTFKDKKIDLTDEQYEWAVKKRSELLDNIYEDTKFSWEAAVGDAESERELRKLATDYAKTLTVSEFRLFEGIGDKTIRQARQRFERGRKASQKRLEQRAKRQGAINWDE